MNNAELPKRKKRKLLMTEEQFQKCIENDIKKMFIEDEKKIFMDKLSREEWVSPGNIVTFKHEYPGLPQRQIAIASIERDRKGRIRLTNMFGTSTPWFDSTEALVDAIDWEWMSDNLILEP